MSTKAQQIRAKDETPETDLPEGWAVAPVSEIFDSWGGLTPSTSNPSYWAGTMPWISSKDVKKPRITGGTDFVTTKALRETRLRICPKGSVLVVVRSGILANTFPVAIIDLPVVINQDLKAFHCPEDALNEWLATAFRAQSNKILAENRKDGTTVQSIRVEQLSDLPLPVPPLCEQVRISEMLGRVLSDVAAVNERIAQIPTFLKRFRQTVLAVACSGKLTAEWRGNTTPEGELPEAWKSCRVDSLFSVRTGGTPSRKIKEYYTDGKIPWIKTAEVKNCDITIVEEYITRQAVDKSNAKVFPTGTLLVAMYGEGKTRGQIGRLTFPAATNQACAALINPKLPAETNQYVFIFLLSQYEALRAEAVGGNQPNLNLSIIKSWEIPLPPKVEQKEIVRRVEALFKLADAIEKRVAAATVRAEKLTQSILAKAFRGELVPTEAELARREGREYESASVLLERIKAEREKVEEKPKRGKRVRAATGI